MTNKQKKIISILSNNHQIMIFKMIKTMNNPYGIWDE